MPPTPPRPTGTQYANALGMTINNDTQRLEIHQDGPQGVGVAAFAELIKEFDNVPREETEKWLRERGAVVFQQQKEDIITCTVNADDEAVKREMALRREAKLNREAGTGEAVSK